MALFSQHHPLVNVKQFAIENCPVEIVDLPNYKMVDLSIVFLYVYQRLSTILGRLHERTMARRWHACEKALKAVSRHLDRETRGVAAAFPKR